ncbi:SLC35E1 [Lepeophtheirus salmonis]|uniref:SLC35E1 n=1 Tax=Lepeophtheirus salmonis TaxID=72036 RepID=A0A7R8GZT9_LEPSM|nr:SLC35E1 [Lepeophtheirus salmonis]CAF2757572.1 SLC35E1 [Lepeophtheirus salmonis]
MSSSPSYGDIRNCLRILLLCGGWYSVSSANGVIGKWILSEFPHPMSLTMVQLLSITLYSRPLMVLLNVRSFSVTWKYYLKLIVPLAFAKFLFSVMSHISIWKVPVSYAHTVKATMPFFTVIIARILFGEKHGWKVYFSLLPIIGGVAIATLTEASFHPLGLICALVATAGFSLINIYSKQVLKESGVHQLRLVLNPITSTNLGGMLFAIFGVFFYNKAKYDENRAKETLPTRGSGHPSIRPLSHSLWQVYDSDVNQLKSRSHKFISNGYQPL